MNGAIGSVEFSDRKIMVHARVKAAALVGHFGFTADDHADIQQDLLLAVLRRGQAFKPGKASAETFARLVIEHETATIIERRTAARRDYRRTESLDGSSQTIAYPTSGAGYRRAIDVLELMIEVRRALSRLPPQLATVAWLIAYHGVTDTSRITGLSRCTIHRRKLGLRNALERLGLRRYVAAQSERDLDVCTLRNEPSIDRRRKDEHGS